MKLCFAHAGTKMADVSPSWARCMSLLCFHRRPVDVSKHLPAVKGHAPRQQGVEDTHQLAADGDDGLLLLQRVLRPGRVIHVQAAERIVRRQERDHSREEQPPQAGAPTLADCCLSLVLPGAVLTQREACQLHDLLRRIETSYVADLGEKSCHSGQAYALDAQQVLAPGNLLAQFPELLVDHFVTLRRISQSSRSIFISILAASAPSFCPVLRDAAANRLSAFFLPTARSLIARQSSTMPSAPSLMMSSGRHAAFSRAMLLFAAKLL